MNDSKINGNLTRDPYISQFTYTNKDGKEVTSKRAAFTIANNIVHAKKIENANFIPVVAFGHKADIAEKYLKKGSEVLIEGVLMSGRYEKDGNTVYTVTLRADNIEFGRNITHAVTNEEIVEENENDFETVDNIPFETLIDDITDGLNTPFC